MNDTGITAYLGQITTHYQELLMLKDEHHSLFFPQWGKQYNAENKSGILFVGKCTNGWKNNSTNLDELLSLTSENRIVQTSNLEWVIQNAGKKTGYNTNRSSFWRVIKTVAQTYQGALPANTHVWTDIIAWTNLYKLAPMAKGNPSENLIKSQAPICAEVLKKEILFFNPKVVVFFTSGWEHRILHSWKNSGIAFSQLKEQKWGNEKYQMHYGKMQLNENQEYIVIFTQHPQGKPSDAHAFHLEKIILEKEGYIL